MDFSNFTYLQEELSLIGVMVLLLIYDLFGSPKGLKHFQWVACLLLGLHTVWHALPGTGTEGSAFGGMYLNFPMGNIVKTILNIGTLLVFLQARNWLESEKTVIRRGEFYLLTLSTLLGMYLMISAGNFLLFVIGLETASLPLAAMVAFDKYNNGSAEAGAKYILSAVFASGLSLYGISLIYGTTGTLYFTDIPAHVTGTPLQLVAFVLFLAGLAFKLSLVPFHQWTPDVYEGAPTGVTAYLSVVSKGAAAFVLMTILYKVFGGLIHQWQTLLYGIIIITITLANLFAIRQQNLKRFLAYSSISQAGYILLGGISGTALGMTGLVYYVLVYMFSNLAAFGVITIVEQRSGKITIDDYNELYTTHPRLSFVLMIALFSLAGIPPFAGFFSKFFIFAAAAEQGFYVLVLIALLNTVLSLFYYLRVIKAVFINKNENPIRPFRSDNYTRLSLTICCLGILFTGFIGLIYENIHLFSFGS